MYKFGVLVSYDCTSSRIRNKIIDICFNFDLNRIQYSIFSGSLTSAALKDIIIAFKQVAKEDEPMSIFIQKVAIGDIKNFELIEKRETELHKFHKYIKSKII